MAKDRTAHMAKRRAHGLTYRELADEFGTSKSTAHRKLTRDDEPRAPQDMEQDR